MINQRYSLLGKIGQGRSSVYLCNDVEAPNSTFAIKVLPPKVDELEKENFIREYFILQKLDHPNIIKSYEIGTAVHVDSEDEIPSGSIFITLEYFESGELFESNFIKNEATFKEVAIQICSALYYLHQSRYIYYDLKPENILVASINGKLQVKLIDLGLAEYSPDPENYSTKGSAQYIAPELLKKEAHNHAVDFYSLGMMLYRIIYDRFPFETKNELEIYKQQIETDFDFPTSVNFSESMINIAKRLLAKDSANRYNNALEIILELRIDKELKNYFDFVPAKIIAGRDRELEILNNYLSDKTSSEIISVKGFDGTGKTTLLNNLNEVHRNSILIGDVKGKSGIELIRYAVRKLIFSETVLPALNERNKIDTLEILNKSDDDLLLSLKSVIANLSSQCEYVLLIDDFNLFDDFSAELFQDIIPLLQINNIKIIVAETSDRSLITDKLHNVKEVNLGPFTDDNLSEFIEKSFIESFPKKELEELISTYSDLVPGSIINFIKDLIQFDILKFSGSGAVVTDDSSKLALLEKTHSAIYDLRLVKLSNKELEIVKTLSLFDLVVDTNTLARLIELPLEEVENFISNIQINNILQPYTSGQTLVFTSDGLKKHVYSKVDDKEKFHLTVAKKISQNLPSFNRNELARHYEFASEYELCYSVLETEMVEAEKHSSFDYMKNILEHLLKLPLSITSMNKVKFKLSEIYYKLSDFNSAVRTIESLQETELIDEKLNNIKTIQAGSLIGIGEINSGKEIINNLLDKIDDNNEKNRLMVELAYAEFEQKNYDEAEKKCEILLNNSELSTELKGRCYNLKGMQKIYQDNDLNSALTEFNNALKNFKESDTPRRVAGMEVNIGNIFTLLSDYTNAEKHWQNALEINRSVGNLEQEGIILLNLGIFYFFRGKFEQAIESYNKAHKIFLSIGNDINQGLVLLNMGEVYLIVCEYEKSFNSLTKACDLFNQKENFEELAEVLLMLCKLYFVIGFGDNLEETLNQYEKNLGSNKLPEKYNLNLKFLKILVAILNKNKIDINELKSITDDYKGYDDKSGYLESGFLLIKNLIFEQKFEEALSEINNEFLVDLCSQNSILEAEREYFLGIISQKHASDKILPPLEHYEKAYNLVKDESVSEVTWKILLAISEIYIERGNLTRAKTYTIYGRELIHFIAENIESPRLRAAYLRQPERFNAIQKFESFYPA
jgi:serine/threonine protein kinase/tetratricopeptide (TPR) repeat protein